MLKFQLVVTVVFGNKRVYMRECGSLSESCSKTNMWSIAQYLNFL